MRCASLGDVDQEVFEWFAGYLYSIRTGKGADRALK